MITFHVILLVRKKSVKSHAFFILFVLYLLLTIFIFLQQYTSLIFEFKSGVQTQPQNIISWTERLQVNYRINLINTIKIVLCMVALKALFRDLYKGRKHKTLVEAEEGKAKDHIVRSLLVLAVFVKEAQLYLTIRSFIDSPNFFGLLYLGFYLVYFVAQIQELLRVLSKYKFQEMMRLKLTYFRSYLLTRNYTEKKALECFYDPFYCDSCALYYQCFRREIF